MAAKAECKARPWQWPLFAALFGVCLSAASVHSRKSAAPEARRAVTEYDVKAAFLLNFVKFVEWPPSEERRANDRFSICILGNDSFGNTLDKIVAGETIENRPLVVKRLRTWPEDCEVLFISNSESDITSILKRAGRGVLTVGEAPDFLSDGGIINFVVEDRHVRFDINRKAAERASLRISSRLLGVARSVLQ